jgi:hypothetical protein
VPALDPRNSAHTVREVEKEKNMKGGEASMLHIIVWNGVVTHVYKLNEHPNKPDTRLEEEFDYKVEYNDTDIKPPIVKCKQGKDGWLIPILKEEEA